MKKRILLIALLVVPMGIALARSQEALSTTTDEMMLADEILIPMQSQRCIIDPAPKMETSTPGEAKLGTQSVNSTKDTDYTTTGTLGTQSYEVKQSDKAQ